MILQQVLHVSATCSEMALLICGVGSIIYGRTNAGSSDAQRHIHGISSPGKPEARKGEHVCPYSIVDPMSEVLRCLQSHV